uniref:Peptidyl-arginine deiminase n=1 Tax=Thermosporothrix sp. COM3 TaxID=2490863 RepID=A0A455SNF3_9CHLR|nr:peptidyl-arginine deiminase [Thermosporothrix sp. COM3]
MDYSRFRVPGEFEKQRAVMMIWAQHENITGMSHQPLHMEMVRAIGAHVPLIIVPGPGLHTAHDIQLLLEECDIPLKNITFLSIESAAVYPRDFGIEVMIDDRGNVIHVDCDFSMYGYMPVWDRRCRVTERFDRRTAEYLGITESVMTRLISEGGDREFNGKGVLMTIEETEVRKRNPGWTKEEVEQELKRIFQLKKLIWLPKGLHEDESMMSGPIPGPDGQLNAYRAASANAHIDEFCRFVAPDTILLAEVTEEEARRSPLLALNKPILDQAFELLQHETDQDGKPFRIVRMPVPEPEYYMVKAGDDIYEGYQELKRFYKVMQDGSEFPSGSSFPVVPAASYCNFLITNGLVVGQQYWEPGKSELIREKDKRAKEVLQALFPEREVVTLPVTALNLGGGGIHCNTRHIPAW